MDEGAIWSRGSAGGGLLQSVERALRVLDYVAAAAGPVPAKLVARDLGLALPTTYHLLATLVRAGYLVHLTEEHCYGLGHRVNDLARALHRQIDVPDEIKQVTVTCHRDAGAAAYYAVLRDSEMVVAYVTECHEHPRIQPLDVGFHEAAHATAFGKLMLAALDPPAREEVLDRWGTPPVTPATLTDPRVLRQQLAQVREHGLAVEVDEFQPDLSCMAAPVTDGAGRFLGAVAISLPTAQLRQRRWEVERAVRTAGVRATRTVALTSAVRGGVVAGRTTPPR